MCIFLTAVFGAPTLPQSFPSLGLPPPYRLHHVPDPSRDGEGEDPVGFEVLLEYRPPQDIARAVPLPRDGQSRSAQAGSAGRLALLLLLLLRLVSSPPTSRRSRPVLGIVGILTLLGGPRALGVGVEVVEVGLGVVFIAQLVDVSDSPFVLCAPSCGSSGLVERITSLESGRCGDAFEQLLLCILVEQLHV